MPDTSNDQSKQRLADRAHTPFLGRQRELQVLHEALGTALAGERQLVLLSGEPGIGKTAIMTQLVRNARESGALVLWGNSYEWEGAPAYWPWFQILGALAREPNDAELANLLGPQTSLIAQLLPEPHSRVSAISSLSSMGAEARRFKLMQAVAQIVRDTSNHRPLVLILDDLHWADLPSLQLLLFLTQEIREAPLLILGAYRDSDLSRQHPGAPILADIVRQTDTYQLALKGLPKPQVAQLVTIITGEAQSPQLIEAVYAETDGNPFFVAEVVRLFADEGRFQQASTGVRHFGVPDSVRVAILRRLARLSDGCNQALLIAAVVGRDFDVRLLERATGTSAADLFDRLDEAARVRLINPGQTPGSYRFNHALVEETLYEESSSVKRARMHLAVAEALELDASDGQHVAELAHHFYRATPLSPPEKIVSYSIRAGDEAMTQFAWDMAASHYEHALAALDLMGQVDPKHQCDLLLALGEAQNHAGSGAGDVPVARASFERAFGLARSFKDGERMARAAVGYAGNNIVAAFGGPKQLELLEEALDALDSEDSLLRARVLARLAIDLWYRSTENRDRSRAFAEEAVAVANRLGDPTLVAFALNALHSSGHDPDNLNARMTVAEQLVIAAEQSGDPIAFAWGYILQIMDLIEAGNLFEAEQSIAWLQSFDERVRISYVTQRVAVCRVMIDLLTGRYQEAKSQVERARTLWQSSAPRQHAGQSFILLRDLGQLESLDEDIQIPDRLHSWRATAQAHRLALALERGHIAAARTEYDALVVDDLGRISFDQHLLSTLAMLAEAAVAFGDKRRAAAMAEMLRPYAERQIIDGSLGVCHGPVAFYLGRLAGVLERWEESIGWLDLSLAICERLGLRPYIARTRLSQAEVLILRDGRRSQAARDHVERAIQEAEVIGMLGLIPRAVALRETSVTEPTKEFGLTPRELDVLRLIAEGLTDAEVAERLFVSPRTVGTHLTSIYGKLNVPSRSGATRMAIQHELI